MPQMLILLILFSPLALAEPPNIVKAEARLKSNQLFDIAVTLQHPDTGWDHYANEWSIEIDDKIVGTRTLHHPHVDEQPFTRYLRDVMIPSDARSVRIIAQCNKGDHSIPYVLINKN